MANSGLERFVVAGSLVVVDQSKRMREVPPSFPAQPPYRARCRRTAQSFQLSGQAYRILQAAREPITLEQMAHQVSSGTPAEFAKDHARLVSAGLLVKETEYCGEPVWINAELRPDLVGIPAVPVAVTWLPTYQCNLSCRHCVNGDLPKRIRHRHELTFDESIRFFDELDESGVERLEVSGGEPFLRRDIIELLEAAGEKSFHVVLFTNGVLINDERIRRLKELARNGRGGLEIHISLDGGSADTHDWVRGQPGNFHRVVNTLERFQAADFPVAIVECSATVKSVDEVDQLAQLCAQNGVRRLVIHPVYEFGNAVGMERMDFVTRVTYHENVLDAQERWKDQVVIRYDDHYLPIGVLKTERGRERRIRQMEELVRKILLRSQTTRDDATDDLQPLFTVREKTQTLRNCDSGITRLFVDAKGDAYPCILYVGNESDCGGNIRSVGLRGAWESQGLRRARIPLSKDSLTSCIDCPHFDQCGINVKKCRIGSEVILGDFFGPSPVCVAFAEELGIPLSVVKAFRPARSRGGTSG